MHWLPKAMIKLAAARACRAYLDPQCKIKALQESLELGIARSLPSSLTEDDDVLKDHILKVQERAYEVSELPSFRVCRGELSQLDRT